MLRSAIPQAMARTVALIVFVAWGATPSSAHVFGGYSGFFSSSYWSSSSSWSSTFRNGEMLEHKEAKSSTFSNGEMVEHKEAKSSTFNNGMVVEHRESNVACAHGRCSKSVTFAKPGSVTMMTQEGPAARFAPQYGSMRARLHGLIGRLPWPAALPMPERQPTLIVTDVVEKRPAAILFLAPRTPSAQTGSMLTSAAWERMNNDMLKYSVCLMAAGGFLLTLIVSSIMLWRISESRELPLHPLSEPLAHEAAEGTVSSITSRSVAEQPKVCTESVELVVKNYLEQMYGRAAQHAHMTATKIYLSRLYAKTCM